MKSIFYVGKTLHLFVFNPGSPQCQACQEARTDAEGEAEQSVSTWMDLQVSRTLQELIFVPNENPGCAVLPPERDARRMSPGP